MRVNRLRKILTKSNDKFSIFADRKKLSKCKITTPELLSLINEFLSDEQKAKLFDLEHFSNLFSHTKLMILESIMSSEIKCMLLEETSIATELDYYDLMNIITALSDDEKIKLLHNSNFLKSVKLEKPECQKIITSLSDENKSKLLRDKAFIQDELKLTKYSVSNIIASLESEEEKTKLIKIYNITDINQLLNIWETFSDNSKIELITSNQHKINSEHLKHIISTLSTDSLIAFFRDNKSFLAEKGISPYEITVFLEMQKQLEIISKIDEAELDEAENRKIFASLSEETKKEIDLSSLQETYKTAIQFETTADKRIKVDLSKDLTLYKGLEEILYINPMRLSGEEIDKFSKLCELYPELPISDDIDLAPSTLEEYREGEAWIKSVLEGIEDEWSDLQKIAFIDNAIGKKISYSPDFDTEVFDSKASRALWKIISSGYGICNGIAQVEKYILDKIGIEAERVSNKDSTHEFLKLKNIEMQTKDGKSIKGDTILDPTWNLAAHRFGAMPLNFCKSYEEIRKNDISDGDDHRCHENEELLSATLNLDEEELREVFASIGVASKKGEFPVSILAAKFNLLEALDFPPEKAITKQLKFVSDYLPEFATCQNSTIKILNSLLLKYGNKKVNEYMVSRVYKKDDKDRRPVLYFYADVESQGKIFYFADSEKNQFEELSQEEFETKFECYEKDKEQNNGYSPWKETNSSQKKENLRNSSGQVLEVAEEAEK